MRLDVSSYVLRLARAVFLRMSPIGPGPGKLLGLQTYRLLGVFWIFLGCFSMAFSQPRYAYFEGRCGQNGFLTGKLQPGQVIRLSSGWDLENCVVGEDKAEAAVIKLETTPWWRYYDYEVKVLSKGPGSSARLYFRFIDETSDHYDLSIYRYVMDWHRVKYDSDHPNIVKVLWSNEPFPSDHCKECERIASKVLEKAIEKGGGCAWFSEEFGGECDLALGGPEDIIGDIICGILTYEVEKVCVELEEYLLNGEVEEASRKLCTLVDLCSPN